MRNKRPVTYKNYVSTEYVTDTSGNKTGRKEVVYSDPKIMYVSVSTPTGNAVLEMFGTNENYDKVIVADGRLDISENSILWVDVSYDTDVPFDYTISKIVRNHNYLTIGIRKVDVK